MPFRLPSQTVKVLAYNPHEDERSDKKTKGGMIETAVCAITNGNRRSYMHPTPCTKSICSYPPPPKSATTERHYSRAFSTTLCLRTDVCQSNRGPNKSITVASQISPADVFGSNSSG